MKKIIIFLLWLIIIPLLFIGFKLYDLIYKLEDDRIKGLYNEKI
jgi:hypothetical protein